MMVDDKASADKPRRRRFQNSDWALFVTVTILGIILVRAVLRGSQNEHPAVDLPKLNDINGMSARIFESDVLGVAPIAEFTVPPKYIPTILSAITPAQRFDYRVLDGWTRGEIKINTKQGRTVVVTLFEIGDNPAAFAVDGVTCGRGGEYKPNYLYGESGDHYLDESSALYVVLKLIHQEQVAGATDTKELRDFVEELELSRGERPPRRE
jgi:hypothetical protein